MSYRDAVEELEITKIPVHERLDDIKEAIKFLTETAVKLVPKGIHKNRAEAYWCSQILTALDNESNYIGGCAVTMDDTIAEISEEEE
jgi:hypothetical protein